MGLGFELTPGQIDSGRTRVPRFAVLAVRCVCGLVRAIDVGTTARMGPLVWGRFAGIPVAQDGPGLIRTGIVCSPGEMVESYTAENSGKTTLEDCAGAVKGRAL